MTIPNTIASDTLVEAVARAISPEWFGEADGKHPLDNFQGQHKVYQNDARTTAQAALTAIETAGYVVCPREPSETMLIAAAEVIDFNDCKDAETERNDLKRAYSAMIRAATHCNNNGKAE